MANESEIVLVIGAGSGMGQATALLLAGKGYRVIGSVFLESEEPSLAALAKERGVTLEIIRMDVRDAAQVHTAVRSIGRIDALVYFAGISLRGFVEDLSPDDIRKVFEVNFYGALNCIQAVLPGMRERRSGRMVVTTSAGGRIGSMSIGGYVSSKFAMEGLVECLAQEATLFDVKVSLLEPGLIQTPHFTVHRNRAPRAMDPNGPYYSWFVQHEKMVDDMLAKGSFGVDHVANVVYGILRAKRPRLRYLVGIKTKFVVNMRRFVPFELFQRMQWAVVKRTVTRPKAPAAGLSGVSSNTH